MLTVQACQQHRLAVMHPNRREIVSRGNRWYTAAAENVGPEARRVAMLGVHRQVTKPVDDGEVDACWECCTQHVGRTKARTWVENIWE